MASASRTVVLADLSTWGTVGLSHIMDLAAVDILICDDGLPADLLAEVETVVGTVELVTLDLNQGTGPDQPRTSPPHLETTPQGAP